MVFSAGAAMFAVFGICRIEKKKEVVVKSVKKKKVCKEQEEVR